MSQYAKKMGFHHHPVTTEDPQSNGFAESFVKTLVKFVHTTIAEGGDPKKELHNYLLNYRATPHSTTGKSPSELLFGRKIQSKLPRIYINNIDSMEEKKKQDLHNKQKTTTKTLLR